MPNGQVPVGNSRNDAQQPHGSAGGPGGPVPAPRPPVSPRSSGPPLPNQSRLVYLQLLWYEMYLNCLELCARRGCKWVIKLGR